MLEAYENTKKYSNTIHMSENFILEVFHLKIFVPLRKKKLQAVYGY